MSIDNLPTETDAETDEALSPEAPKRLSLGRVAPVLVWIALCVAAVWRLLRLGAPETFFFDEWSFVLGRRTLSVQTLFTPHNGHLSVVPVLVYRVLFAVFGMKNYTAYRMAGLLVHVAVATMVYRYARQRIGEIGGLASGSALLLLGSGWQNILWPFQLGFMGSIAAGIGAWLFVDRDKRVADLMASCLVLLSLSCSGLGIAVLVGTGAFLVSSRKVERVVRVCVAPAVIYGIWYIKYGESQGQSSNLARIPRFVLESGGFASGGLFGRDLLWGRVIFGLCLGLGIGLLVARAPLGHSMLAPSVALVSNWVLAGYSRAQLGDPGASRYVYVGAAFLILTMAEVLRHFPRRLVHIGVPILAILSVTGNAKVLRDGANGLRETTEITRIELRAVEWARDRVADGYVPDKQRMPQLEGRKFLLATSDLGSPAATDEEVAQSDNLTRSAVDRISVETLVNVIPTERLQESTAKGALVVTASSAIVNSGVCAEVLPATGGPAKIEIAMHRAPALALRSGSSAVKVSLRRYSDGYPESPSFSVEPALNVVVSIATDDAPSREWHLQIVSESAFILCS
jgi:hypothetical protein